MKYGKIIGILLVIGIAATFLGVVSAAEVDISGVKINVPDGYKENTTGSSEKVNGDSTTIVKKYYSDNDTFFINVISNQKGAINTPQAQGGQVEKTINDVKGLYDSDKHQFEFVKDGKLVVLTGVSENELNEIIVK